MYYSDFTEKDFNFEGNVLIENIEMMQRFIYQYSNRGERYLFRGVKEAKYKLYTTAQREWLFKGAKLNSKYTYQEFIYNMVTRFYQANDKLMQRYFKSLGLDTNLWNALTYMQHYGAPTPMLDFTTKLNVALFFATIDAEYSPTNSIEDFFSIYILEQNKNDFLDFSLFEDRNIQKNLNYLYHTNKKLFFVHNKSRIGKGNSLYAITNNLNMTAQNGRLLLHKDEDLPVECSFRLRCYNIHKSLTPYIRQYLSKHHTMEKLIFPNPKEIAQSCLDSFYKKVLE